MQDYNYLFSNCMELTVEVSCDKRPPSRTLATHLRNNNLAILAVLSAVDGGVKGVVVDHSGRPFIGARVRVEGIDKETITSDRGEFWRLLLPGTYIVTASTKHDGEVFASDPLTVVVTRNLGEGATVRKLVIAKQSASSLESCHNLGCSRVGQSG